MPVKLLLAKPADGKEGPKVFVQFWLNSDPQNQHTLKLHQSSTGEWYPELDISLKMNNKDIQQLRESVVSALCDAAAIIESGDFDKLKDIAELVSNHA